MTQFADQVILRLTSQLISSIARVLQKLLQGLNGTAVSTFAIPTLLALFVSRDLNLNDSESVMLLLG